MPTEGRAGSGEGIKTDNFNAHCGAWLLVASYLDVQLHSPQLAGNFKVQARCLRSGGFVSRLSPKSELRNPGSIANLVPDQSRGAWLRGCEALIHRPRMGADAASGFLDALDQEKRERPSKGTYPGGPILEMHRTHAAAEKAEMGAVSI